MLRSLSEPKGYRLEARDGEIGRCKDFLFDDERWTLRYMVADTGGWLSGRKVLISPAQIEDLDWQLEHIAVKLTREQIEQSPPLETDAPVSRRYEQAYNSFHALPDYWLGSGLWGDFPLPSGLTGTQAARLEPLAYEAALGEADAESGANSDTSPGGIAENEDVHLRSVREVTGYDLVAVGAERDSDGGNGSEKIGRIVDFIVEDSSWALHALVVDSSRLPLSKKILLPVDAVIDIDWVSRQVNADVPPDIIDKAPPFDPNEPINARLEVVRYDAVGRPYRAQ
ncbi:PRC-barrel domain protein [Thiorhodovibrio winogradskyi]|uniref:PRC-barrel domain protein n=1 Tax=Thiorhodovibrio winogradskyi TaxID=77007 RepID=A0ABZ0SCL6_9GAMM|nr:PRC-barrel domain-containing protein [Thiorhodovibrio winogradskyi]